jgi:hypothetical protein
MADARDLKSKTALLRRFSQLVDFLQLIADEPLTPNFHFHSFALFCAKKPTDRRTTVERGGQF